MCGAEPKYLSLSFIIEEGFSMEDFQKIINSIKLASEKAGVKIVTGDTKVVERGKGDKIYINTSGIGLFMKMLHWN
jgi:hydrogenase expression/formation protein HypE